MSAHRRIDLRSLVLTVVLMFGFVASLVSINVVTARRAAERQAVAQPECPDLPPSNSAEQDECVEPPDEGTAPPPSVAPTTPSPSSPPETNPLPSPTAPNAPPSPPTQIPTPAPAPAPPSAPTPVEIARGNTSKLQVIFTFDAGAGTQSLDAILSVLRNHGVKGTFFVTGKWTAANTAGLQRIASDGHEIFNHTYNHLNLTTISDQTMVSEFQQADQLISSLSGRSTKPYFRPPYGARNQHVLDVAWSQGYRSVYWTVDALDWKESEGMTAQAVKERILLTVAPGVIYLMHIGDNITGQILDDVFNEIELRGYRIVSLSEGLL